MQCPTCNVSLMMTDRQGIEIDYCPQCRGIWLDRGELDKIIERSSVEPMAAAPQSRPSNDRVHHHDQHHGYNQSYGGRPRKKKSLLSEIFDF